MPRFKARHRSDHDADLLFDLMNDFESHAGFIPLCKRTRILSEKDIDDDRTLTAVRYVLAYQRYAFRKTFDLVMESNMADRTIRMIGDNADARSVEATFTISEMEDGGSQIELDGDYRLSNLTLTMADKSGLVSRAFEKIVAALDKQASQIERR